MPNYPHGKVFPGYERKFYLRDSWEGVIVHRIWVYPAIGTGLQRMLSYLSFTFMSLFGLLRANRPDYIFVESPPIFLSFPAYLAGILWRAPYIFNVSDMWPDVIVDGGFLKEGLIVRWMRAVERWSYRKATYVNAVTDGVHQTLLRDKSVPAEKLLFLPNGADTVRFQPRSSDENLKKALGLENKKIFLWAGTLGFAHGIENILQAAKLLEQEPDVHFLFVGNGSAKESLVRLRDAMGLGNVTFQDAVPLALLPPYFSISEAGLASLIALPLFDGARPSKFFPILASGKPLIFVGRGEAARLVEEAKAGVVVPTDNPEALASAVLELARDPQLVFQYGRNGRHFVESSHQWSHVIANWTTRLRMLQAQPASPTNSAQI
jgi:glycosyltransferase involved in cell wall biosynthesis